MAAASRPILDSLKVMVVDDNRHMRALVMSVLHALGVGTAREFAEAQEAYRELGRFKPDLIIVDWHMEPLDGLEFARMVRNAAKSPTPYVPLIMLSGYTEMKRICEARDVGVNEFLAKPISARSLYQRIVSLIANPRPFVRTASYFGPDRRRRDVGAPDGMADRRGAQLPFAAGPADSNEIEILPRE
ncbi:MAG: response regulator [Rhodospirillales bacterium]